MPRSKGKSGPKPPAQPPVPPSEHLSGLNARMNQSKSTRNSSYVTRKVTWLRKAIFPFMELPPELRNCVYEFLIEDMCTVEADLVNAVAYLIGIDHFHGTYGYPREISSKFPILLKSGALRASIRGCHLNEVSRTIRQEFLSMLWSRAHLRYCCCFRTEANKPRTISLDLLRGNVTYVLWDMSIMCRDQDRAMRFVEFLKMLDFRGTIKLQGDRVRIENLREALEGIAVADNTKKAQRIAMQKVEEIDEPDRIVALERRRWSNGLFDYCKRWSYAHLPLPIHPDASATEKVNITFDIDLRKSRHEHATT